MAKTSGGVRNYSKVPSTKSRRRGEYNRVMASGTYDPARSFFDESGGYVVTHRGHNQPRIGDLEQYAARALARKGYKVTLGDERNTISKQKVRDGDLYNSPMDIKTITQAGANTIKLKLEKAVGQGAETAVLVQGTPAMTRAYVEAQIRHFSEHSPLRARQALKYVIVVSKKGNVHRHKLP